MLQEIIESKPEIDYQGARSALLAQGTPEQGADLTAVETIREKLRTRLESLQNQYHNQEHSAEVAKRTGDLLGHLANPELVSPRERQLMIEAAWRHDDDHAGNTYRQLVEGVNGGSMSNEELAVLLAIDDMRTLLNTTDIEFLESLILATSFGQSATALQKAFPNDPHLQQNLKRDYAPKTPIQKLLALADVGGFRKGWDEWVNESLRLVEEQGSVPEDVDAWLKTREGFTIYYIKPLLESLQSVLTPEFYAELIVELQAVINEVLSLKDPNDARRADYTRRLNEIRDRVGNK